MPLVARRHFLRSSALIALGAMSRAPSAFARDTDPLRWRRNETIQEGRRVALGLLQPSERDLQHGLALHAAALVCDSYGFAPRVGLSVDRVNAAIQAGASAREVDALWDEASHAGYLQDRKEQEEYIDAWKASGVTCLVQNAGEEGQAPLRMLRRLSSYTHAADVLPDVLMRAATPDDIVAAKNAGKHCLYLATNGVPLQQNWDSPEQELFYIGIFFKLGVRTMHLTYNRRNMLGDGCAEVANGGLSDFGRAAVREMNRVGVIVDLAHSGYRTSIETAQHSGKPVVVSHTACAALQKDIRCIPDEVIRSVVGTGGYIGITCIPRFLGRTGDIRAMLDHIDYAVRTFGADHVAIGTDYAYRSGSHVEARKRLKGKPDSRPKWGHLWPPTDWENEPHMIPSMMWTNWPLFTVGLVQRGHSDDDIRKIIGGNMMRVARSAFPSI
jgi:membrane dipeptidase